MSDHLDDILGEIRGLTSAGPTDAARLRERLPADLTRLREGGGVPALRVVGDDAPEPPPAAHPGRAARIGWVALAALALVGVGVGAWSAQQPAAPPPPVALSASLAPGAAPVQIDGLALTLEGEGTLEGTSRAPVVRWESGRVALEVDPAAGLDVRVATPDAEVRVLGTVFSVERTALGTTTAVERGTVSVSCGDGTAVTLTHDASVTCLPTTAGGLLGRAQALRAASAPVTAVLGALDAGLAVARSSSATATELAAQRVLTLEEMGRTSDALSQALALVEAGHPLRRQMILQAAVRLALAEGACEAVRSLAETLQAEGGTVGVEVAACEG